MNYELRICKLVDEKTTGKNRMPINKLVNEMNQAAKVAKLDGRVNNRMLARIKEYDTKLGITPKVMQVFAAYFPELLLQPAFVVPGVLDGLVGQLSLSFVLGAKPRPEERRNDISHWDAMALTELFTCCSKLARHHNFDIRYVLWRDDIERVNFENEPWHTDLFKDDCSVVSIGSPLASLCSEIMLAAMFKVAPFQQPDNKGLAKLPFAFGWRPSIARGFKSAFGISLEALKNVDAKIAAEVEENRSSTFLLEGRLFKVPVHGDQWRMHGIIAAQRQPSGKVWLVVSGLAGPATHAAAQKVARITAELPWKNGQASQVLWVPVKADVRTGRADPGDGDDRHVVNVMFDGNPRLW